MAASLKAEAPERAGPPPAERPASPEQSCAICLGPPENKSFTDSCFHTFCFSCLLEWSKVKAECPLCKQRFKSIVHNVRSFEDYDRYFVSSGGPSSSSASGSAASSSSHAALGSALLLAHHLVYSSPLLGGDQWISRHMFTWRPRRRNAPRTTGPARRHRVGRSSAVAAVAAAAQLSPLPSSSAERRSLYELDLWVCPPNNRRSARHFTPTFFRDHPACTHRLMPWLDRELQALLAGGEAQLEFTTELVLALITRYEVCSAEFAEHVRPFFGTRTAHFLHELAAFVASPLDMVAYDRVAVYDLAANVLARGSPAAQFLPLLSEDDEDAPARPPVVLAPRDPSEPGPSGLHHGTTVDLAAASESDDSDCVVVTSAVPAQPRTPVVIELSSSDDEGGADPSRAAAGPAAAPRPQPLRRCKVFSQRPSKFWSGDSDSSSDSDSDYEDPRLQARRIQRRSLVQRRVQVSPSHQPPRDRATMPRKRPRRVAHQTRPSDDD